MTPPTQSHTPSHLSQGGFLPSPKGSGPLLRPSKPYHTYLFKGLASSLTTPTFSESALQALQAQHFKVWPQNQTQCCCFLFDPPPAPHLPLPRPPKGGLDPAQSLSSCLRSGVGGLRWRGVEVPGLESKAFAQPSARRSFRSLFAAQILSRYRRLT